MKRLLFGIFAHPDDEAFGPSATLMKLTEDGTELHLICLTDGQNGMNPDKLVDLGKTRLAEWRQAGTEIGAAGLYNLGYVDGTLCNNMYHEIADKISAIVHTAANQHANPVTVDFMSFDVNGITGHLDHIAASYIATYVFYRLKDRPPENITMRQFYYFCLSASQCPNISTSFVFMDKGRPADYIDHVENVSQWVDKKFAIMQLHHSQRADAQAAMKVDHRFHLRDNFCVRS